MASANQSIRSLICAILGLGLLSGCGGGYFGDGSAGAEKEYDPNKRTSVISRLAAGVSVPPDEFGVLRKKPLVIPGNFDALPEPQPGIASARDANPVADARLALGLDAGRVALVPASTGSAPSAGEAALISGVGPIDPDIRATTQLESASNSSVKYGLESLIPSLKQARLIEEEGVVPSQERELMIDQGYIAAPGLPPAAAAPTSYSSIEPIAAQSVQPQYIEAAPVYVETSAPQIVTAEPVSTVPTFGTIVEGEEVGNVSDATTGDTGLIFIE